MRYVSTGVVLVALLAAAAVPSCKTVAGSANVIKLDKELDGLYQQRIEAERTTPGSGAALSGKLANLSQRAEKEGNAATDPATAAALYRIAATAAWTAGPPRNTQVLPVSDKGTKACEKLPNGPASQPRDCALLKVAPLLAGLDEKQTEIGRLRGTSTTIPAASLNDAAAATKDVTLLMKQVLAARTTFVPAAQPFDDYLKHRLTGQFCTLQRFVGQIDASMPPEELMKGVTDAARDAQSSLQGAAISTACLQTET